jgi:hypothetical protein
MTAAITARAEVRNSGVMLATATRVAGSEPLKMMTPMSPLTHPSVVRCIAPILSQRDGSMAAASSR